MKAFETQICTTIEQSKRLLDLGLKSETADCTWAIINEEPVAFIGQTKINCSKITINGKEEAKREIIHYPAWSLHRLIEMCNKTQFGMTISIYKNEVTIDGDLFEIFDNTYDNLISIIEWLIKGNRFNKEYLKQ